MKKILIFLIILVSIFTFLIAGCSSSSISKATEAIEATEATEAIETTETTEATEADPIKIGAILDFTGYAADWGEKCQTGIELALEEVGYEVAGRKIELIIKDAGSDPTKSLDALKTLVQKDKINISIGPLLGDAQLAVSQYAMDNRVVMASLFNGMTDLANIGNWIVFPTTCYAQSIPLGWYAYDELGYKTMVTVGSDFNAGYDFVNGAADAFKEKGGEVIQQIWADMSTTDYSPYIASLKKADAFMFLIAGITQQTRLELQYIESGMNNAVLHITQDGGNTPTNLDEYGSKFEGVIGESSYIPFRDTPINNAFVEGIKNKSGNIPGGEEANSYIVTKTILAALEATNGNDDYDYLWPAILDVKMETPQGMLSFADNGVAITDIYITQVLKVEDKYQLVPIKVYSGVTDPKL